MDKEDMRLIRVKLEMVKTLLQEVDQYISRSQVGYSPGYSPGLRSEGFSAWIESALFSVGKAHELILKHLSSSMPKINRNELGSLNESESLTEDDGSLNIIDRPIRCLGLSTRAQRCLMHINIVTVGDLIKKTVLDLQKIENFGATSLHGVVERLKEYGLQLSE